MKEPGPHHPITITPHAGPVRVRLGGRIIAGKVAPWIAYAEPRDDGVGQSPKRSSGDGMTQRSQPST